MSQIEKMDGYYNSLKIGKSPIVDSWLLMSSPGPVLCAVLAYLTLVVVGPRVMKARRPLRLTSLITYYNALQVLLSSVICYKALNLNLFRDGIIYAGCRYPGTTQNIQLLDVGWWYFIAKFTELLDTVFFVIRKKNQQVTFLHVYHHALMALYSWSYLKFAAGGQGAVLALLNSAVHVLMYTYYFLAGLGPRFQKYLWWKKYVTTIQLIQFVFMLTYCVWTHITPRCQFTNTFTYIICSNVSIFLLLFLNFYTKSYAKKTPCERVDLSVKETKNKVNNPNEICNGVCSSKNLPETEDEKSYGIGLGYGNNNTKNNKVFITRRKIKAAYGSECDFDGVVKE